MASIQLSRYEAEEGDLPDVCMCCGAPATERKRRRFSSYPLWVIPLLLWDFHNSNPFWLLPQLLWDWRSTVNVADKNTRYIRCYTLFCPRHTNYWRVRNWIVWGALAVILMLLVVGFVLAGLLAEHAGESVQNLLFGSWCIGMVVLPLVWLISIPISQVMAIHPANPTRHEVTLKRVSPSFVEAVRHYRAQRKDQSQAEDYREHFRPRRGDGNEERMERS